MEAVGFRYSVTRRILFQLRDVKRLWKYANAHADITLGQVVLAIVDPWMRKFEAAALIHGLDEYEFDLTQEEIEHLVAVCPEFPTLDQLAAGEEKGTSETDFRESLRDNISNLWVEHESKNCLEPGEANQPWYCHPLNAIGRHIWWICRVMVSPIDGFVTVYANGFPMLKCKFRPRNGSQVNVFEVVKNLWCGGNGEQAWTEWMPGTIHTLEEFIAAMNETRRLVNSKLGNWDDVNKVFVCTPAGDNLVLRGG